MAHGEPHFNRFVIASLALVIEFLQGTGKMVLRFIQKHHYRVAVVSNSSLAHRKRTNHRPAVSSNALHHFHHICDNNSDRE